MTTTDLQKLLAEATKGPWSLSGVRTSAPLTVGQSHRFQHITANGENICAVYFEMQTGLGFNDARLIAMAPDLAARVIELEAENKRLREIIRVAKANIFNVQIGLESGTTKHAANEQLAKVRATLGSFDHDQV